MRLKNEFEVDGNVTKVKIICKGKELTALIDTEDLERVSQFKGKWYGIQDGDHVYVRIEVKRKAIRLHRYILPSTDKLVIDHINGNTLDNRKENLRIATKGQNARNSKIRKHNKSGVKGVHFDKRSKKWVAEIKHNYKNIRFGYYSTKLEAAIAYNTNVVKYQGEFAFVNDIEAIKLAGGND